MRFRGILGATAAVVTVAAAAVAGPATAGAAARPGARERPVHQASAAAPRSPHVRTVNLHAALARLRGHVRSGPEMGIVRPLRGRTARARAGGMTRGARPGAGQAGCAEPNCDLPWNGGPVEHAPKLYVIFWGPAWQTDSGEQASESYLLSFFDGLGRPGDHWSAINSQYTDGSGGPVFSGAEYVAGAIDTAAPPAEVQQSDLASEAVAGASFFGIPDVSNDQVVVVSQSGTCFADGFVGSSCQPVQAQYCAWHSDTGYGGGTLSYTNLPYQLDAGGGCGEGFVNSPGTWDGFSIVGGHEYAEAITDPYPNSGYWDPSDNVSGGEIGDKCAWGGQLWQTPDPVGDITLSTGTFAVQSLWDNNTGACQLSATTGPQPTSVRTSLSGGGKAGAAITVPPGTTVTDSAVLSGTNAASATGTVTYQVYSDAACGTPAAAPMTVSVSGGAVPASPALKLAKAGKYYWTAAYSGDSLDNPSASGCGKEIVTVPPVAALDTVASAFGKTSATVAVSTSVPGDLLVAYVGGRGPRGKAQAAAVSASGLTWHLVARSDAGRGDAEAWYARAPGKLSKLHVTVREKYAGWPAEISVVAYKNAPGIGAHAVAHSAKGAPAGSVTTTMAGSWVFAAGDDWATAAGRTPGAGQVLVRQVTDSSDTYWVQATKRVTLAAGTAVTINDTRPAADPYNLVIVEIR